MTTTLATLSQRQINALRREAAGAGDLKMVAICDRATRGSERARRERVKAIRAAEAMAD